MSNLEFINDWDTAKLSEFLENAMAFPRNIKEVSLNVESFQYLVKRTADNPTPIGTPTFQKANIFLNKPAFVNGITISIKVLVLYVLRLTFL